LLYFILLWQVFFARVRGKNIKNYGILTGYRNPRDFVAPPQFCKNRFSPSESFTKLLDLCFLPSSRLAGLRGWHSPEKIEIHGLTPVVLARQVPFKILHDKILDLCYSSAPLREATGLLCIYGLAPVVLSQEIIKSNKISYKKKAAGLTQRHVFVFTACCQP
jgi:hypothetical protein